jgi:hypothetical protein
MSQRPKPRILAGSHAQAEARIYLRNKDRQVGNKDRQGTRIPPDRREQRDEEVFSRIQAILSGQN